MLDLFRLRAFTAEELTESLPRAVNATRDVLLDRYHPGTVRRLGGTAAEVRPYVEKLLLRDEQDDLDVTGSVVYAVASHEYRPDGIRVVGLATLSKHVKLQQARLPLPTGITDRLPLPSSWLSPSINMGHVNGTGWTMPEYDDHLSTVYATLRGESQGTSLWTVEPLHSGERFHNAIQAAGLFTMDEPTRYDVGEDGHYVPPVSQAYVYDSRL